MVREIGQVPVVSYEDKVTAERMRQVAIKCWDGASKYFGLGMDKAIPLRKIIVDESDPKNIFRKMVKLLNPGSQAWYHPMFRMIRLDPFVNEDQMEWNDVMLAHELGHALTYGLSQSINRPAKSLDEGIAEVVAFFIRYDLEYSSAGVREYIDGPKSARDLRRLMTNRKEVGYGFMSDRFENLADKINDDRFARLFIYLIETGRRGQVLELLRSTKIIDRDKQIRAVIKEVTGKDFQPLIEECADWWFPNQK